MRFSYYKTANHIAPCGVVQCGTILLAVRLCHFVGGFGAIFAVCAVYAVWWTPLHVSALREARFGENLTEEGLDITPKFVKAFQRNNGNDLLFHLVYRFEGISLEHLLYGSQNRLWWNWLKTTQEGENAIKGIMFQLVSLSEALS